MTGRKPTAPQGMGKGGQRVWRSIVGTYELRPDELLTLEDVCRLTDMIDQLVKAWADQGKPLMTTGSMGQLVIHPLISELRANRLSRNALCRQLRLPDSDGSATPNRFREAALSRWATAHGEPAAPAGSRP